jgi:hypothetical protein
VPEVAVSPAEHAALTQRVTSVEAGVESIRKDIHALVSKFDERSKMPWGTLLAGLSLFWMVITSFVTIGGGVVAWGLLSLIDNMATDQRDFRDEVLSALRDIPATYVSRNEWSERNLARNEEVTNLRDARIRADQDIQRQIDQLRQDFQAFAASMGNGRDTISDLKKEQDRLRDRINELLSRQLPPNGAR